MASLVVVAGCTIGDTPDPQDMTTPCAVEGVTGAVPGIALAIRSTSCVYEVGGAASFTYEITVDAAAPPLHYAAETTTCTRRPHPYTTDPSSLTASTLYNPDRGYCWDCGFECAPGEPELTIQPAAGTTSAVLEWQGRTGSPFDSGELFEPGEYAVRVQLDGGDSGIVSAELPITIVP